MTDMGSLHWLAFVKVFVLLDIQMFGRCNACLICNKLVIKLCCLNCVHNFMSYGDWFTARNENRNFVKKLFWVYTIDFNPWKKKVKQKHSVKQTHFVSSVFIYSHLEGLDLQFICIESHISPYKLCGLYYLFTSGSTWIWRSRRDSIPDFRARKR